MSLKQHFELMAEYNQSMNESIYRVIDNLDEKALFLDRGAYFSSIIGTLNHIFTGDLIWLTRFNNHIQCFKSLELLKNFQQPNKLDTILYSDFNSLYKARTQLDVVIKNFCSELDTKILEQPLSYKNTKGLVFSKKFSYLILHFLNHQTHHRGQLSTLLNQMDIDVGVTDLLMKIPEDTA